jgi:alkylresorcinol/alkylpyrone synthase
VGFEHRDNRLRIILAHAVRDLAGPMIEGAVDALLARNGLRRSDIRFWVAHPGGRKVIDNVQRHLGLTDEQWTCNAWRGATRPHCGEEGTRACQFFTCRP